MVFTQIELPVEKCNDADYHSLPKQKRWTTAMKIPSIKLVFSWDNMMANQLILVPWNSELSNFINQSASSWRNTIKYLDERNVLDWSFVKTLDVQFGVNTKWALKLMNQRIVEKATSLQNLKITLPWRADIREQMRKQRRILTIDGCQFSDDIRLPPKTRLKKLHIVLPISENLNDVSLFMPPCECISINLNNDSSSFIESVYIDRFGSHDLDCFPMDQIAHAFLGRFDTYHQGLDLIEKCTMYDTPQSHKKTLCIDYVNLPVFRFRSATIPGLYESKVVISLRPFITTFFTVLVLNHIKIDREQLDEILSRSRQTLRHLELVDTQLYEKCELDKSTNKSPNNSQWRVLKIDETYPFLETLILLEVSTQHAGFVDYYTQDMDWSLLFESNNAKLLARLKKLLVRVLSPYVCIPHAKALCHFKNLTDLYLELVFLYVPEELYQMPLQRLYLEQGDPSSLIRSKHGFGFSGIIEESRFVWSKTLKKMTISQNESREGLFSADNVWTISSLFKKLSVLEELEFKNCLLLTEEEGLGLVFHPTLTRVTGVSVISLDSLELGTIWFLQIPSLQKWSISNIEFFTKLNNGRGELGVNRINSKTVGNYTKFCPPAILDFTNAEEGFLTIDDSSRLKSSTIISLDSDDDDDDDEEEDDDIEESPFIENEEEESEEITTTDDE